MRRFGAMALTGALLLFHHGGCARHDGKGVPAGASALHRAIAANDLAKVEAQLGQGKGVHSRGIYGWTPLHMAAIYGADEVAAKLLEKGAKVAALDRTQMTPLHWAARKGKLAVVQQLLARGASVKARNAYDQTPLHEARTQQIAALLLQKGADIHARDVDGMTPLHRAPTRMVAQFLISKGASIRARAKDGRTPLDMPPTVRPRSK